MAKRKIELFIDVKNEKEFENVLNKYSDKLICAEIYSSFAGSCTALDRLLTIIKLDWSDGQLVLLKVLADDITSLRRFHGFSQPVYMFVVNRRVTKVFRGVDNIGFGEIAKKEIQNFKMESESDCIERPRYGIDEMTPDEQDYYESIQKEREENIQQAAFRKSVRQADRKRHRAELMVPYLQQYNFVLYWPHSTHAHPELYERWDMNNIIMVGREELQLTKELAEDIMYASDAPLNEASLHALLAAPALAICFRLLDTDKHFVSLVRKILYEEIPPPDESKPIRDQLPQMTAFDIYKSYSPTREEIRQKRCEERIKKKEEFKEKRARRLSEVQRLARQAIEEAMEAQQRSKEQQKLELLKAGKLKALAELEQKHDKDIDIEIPEELSEEEEQSSEEEDPEEYFPPPGLLIPGFYAPSNDIAKANGLAILFPKLVKEHVTPQPEYLPPHVLVMISIPKRYKAIQILEQYVPSIIHMGIFEATNPFDAKHIAYTIKQFDKMHLPNSEMENIKLAVMLSLTFERALLELMDLNPVHVSRDPLHGEEECAAMFPVGYGDEYQQFEDFIHKIED